MGNTISAIYDPDQEIYLVSVDTPAILDCAEYRDFWISWFYNSEDYMELLVGTGMLFSNVFMRYNASEPHGIHSVSLASTELSYGFWRFQDNAGKF